MENKDGILSQAATCAAPGEAGVLDVKEKLCFWSAFQEQLVTFLQHYVNTKSSKAYWEPMDME